MEVTNLQTYKKNKLDKRIIEDIDNILKVLDLTQKSLSFFKKYKPVQELISVIETNKVLLELKKKAYARNTQLDQNQK